MLKWQMNEGQFHPSVKAVADAGPSYRGAGPVALAPSLTDFGYVENCNEVDLVHLDALSDQPVAMASANEIVIIHGTKAAAMLEVGLGERC